jgi:uncharacterized protein YecE (DUF72 family)
MAVPRIGISGWRYKPWRGTFYPEDLAQKRELEYASRHFNSIEINGSFYSLQRVDSWKRWRQETPKDFVFSIKGARYITHLRRLREIDKPLANFFAQGLLALGPKLGPFLWQFPPSFKFEPELLGSFFEKLPRNMEDAAVLAWSHDDHLKGRAFAEIEENGPLRHAVEIRHDSFKTPAFVALLRRQKIGLVVADTAGKWPLMEDLTADFVYCRLHGDEKLYVSGYTPAALDRWGERVNAWLRGGEPADAAHASEKPAAKRKSREVFVYFDNDVKVRAPFDAMELAERTGGFVPPPREGATADAPARVSEEAREHWPGMRAGGRRRAAPPRSRSKRD